MVVLARETQPRRVRKNRVAARNAIVCIKAAAERLERFPDDFMFKSNHKETAHLQSRLVILNDANAVLVRKLAALEEKYDAQFRIVFDAIRELMTPPEPRKKRSIGFVPWEGN